MVPVDCPIKVLFICILKNHGFIKNYNGEITLIALVPSPYVFIINICLEDMNVFSWFNEIPPMTLF